MTAPITDRRLDVDDAIDLQGDIVNVLVGKDKRPYLIHEDILRSSSQFFKAALKKEWKEGQTHEVKLPAEDRATFGRYAQYLYSGNIVCKGTSTTNEYNLLADLYVLGEKMLDDGFQNAVLNAFITTTKEEQKLRYPGQEYAFEYPGVATIRKIYSKTTDGSPARRFLVDLYVVNANGNFELSIGKDKAHPEFLVDLARAYAERREVTETERKAFEDKTSGTACAYHRHEEGEPCSAKRRKLG